MEIHGFEKEAQKRIGKQWILLALFGAVYFFLKYLSPVLSPVLVAMVFVTIFGPLLKRIQDRYHIHRQIGAAILLFLSSAIFLLLAWVLFSWIYSNIPLVLHWLKYVEKEYLAGRVEVSEFLEQAFTQVVSKSPLYMKTVMEFGGYFITFVIATVLLAKDYDKIMNHLLERKEFHVVLQIICKVVRYLATYVKAQVTILTAISLLCAIVLTVLQRPYGFLWGILAGVMDALPFVGTGVVLVPLSIVALFQRNYIQGIGGLLLYGACIVIRQLLEPKLIGKRIGVSPIVVLISIYGGIKLFGVVGILKGPLGFVVIRQAYESIYKRNEDEYAGL